MDKKVAVLVIPGMGSQDIRFAEEMINEIVDALLHNSNASYLATGVVLPS